MKKALTLLCTLAATAIGTLAQTAHAGCVGGPDVTVTTFTRTFSAGSAWNITVSSSPCEGLVLNSATFTPSGGAPRMVLYRGSIAEIHVPYDNNQNRFLDVTDSTSGLGANAIALSQSECDGTLFDQNHICIANEDGGYGWKLGNAFRSQQGVEIFMASQLGNYTYINKWTFQDDGTIEPEVGLTGQLQTVTSNPADLAYGVRLNPESAPSPQVGLNHMHNFYYRLDFDIAGGADDQVGRFTFTPNVVPNTQCANAGACGTTVMTPITTEAAQTWTATSQQSWFVYDKLALNADGRRIGYEIRPHLGGLWRGMVNNGEPWANAELYVTAFNGCERFAARNQAPYLDPALSCSASTAKDLTTMVNGENVNGKDLVVWYALRHHHIVRDEDQAMMPIEWTGFEMEPRSFAASNPAP